MRSHIQHKSARSKPTLEQVLQSECDVCFVPFNRVTPRKIEEGLQILCCSRCYIHVHKCCYDFEPSHTVLSQKISQFLCERCTTDSLAQKKCFVCYGNEGAMKRIGQKQYVHVYCGLMHNQIEVLSYYPTISFKKSSYYEDSHHNCEICHNRNAHEACADDLCKKKVHVYCAKKQHVTLSKQIDQPKCWNHKISAGNNSVFDLSDQIIPYELLSEEVETNLREIQQIGLNVSSKEQFKQKVHMQYLQQTRSRRRSTKKLKRGGFSFVLCPQHDSIIYCYCYGKADGEQMVLCECCFQWYHQKCVKYTASEDSYVCQYCKVFYQFKRKGVEEVKGGRTQYDVGRIEVPLKLSVMDCIWVMRVLDNRIRGGLAPKMVKQLPKYPLKSSCMDLLIRHQNRNKLTALADDCLTQFSTSEQLIQVLKPRVVLAADGQGKPYVVVENVEYNRLIRKGIELFIGMGLRGQGFTTILKELEFKERALSDQYEQIIELSKVEQNYQQVQILKQKAQAYNFIEIIKKINQKTPVIYSELQDSIKKATAVQTLPRYLTQILLSKYNTVTPLIQKISQVIETSPQNSFQITQLVEQLQSHNIVPPEQYQHLIMQKKFIQNLHLYYIKQEGNKIDEQLTIQQKIDLLISCSSLKPSSQLIEIINSYKPLHSKPIWPHTDILTEKYQNISIEYEIKQIIKRRFCKQQKFFAIVDRVKQYKCNTTSEDVKNVIQNWKSIRKNYDTAIVISLQNIVDFQQLSENLRLVNNVIQSIDNFPIKIQEDNPNKSILTQARSRKQELEQLKILYTQSQLQKNPLSLPKILPSLPKNNPLVKQWHSLRKQQANYISKFSTILARINERLQYFKNEKKLTRKQQIKQNNQKPTINEVTEFIQILKNGNVDMGNQARQLNKIVNNSIQIANKVRKYIEEKGNCNSCNLEELSVRRKDIEQQRKKILNFAQLNLKNQLIQLYHIEICNRMRSSLISPGLDLQKISTLLKYAQEESLSHAQSYIALKQKFQTKNQKSKQVSLIKTLQQNLSTEASKDLSPNYTNLYVYRRSLIIPEASEIKIKNTYIEDLIEKSKQLKQKISKILQLKPAKWDLNQARNVYLEALKCPFVQPQLNRMSVQITKGCELLRRWREIGKSFNHLHPIFLDYQIISFTIEEIQSIKRQIKKNEDQITKLNLYVSNFDENNRDQLEQIIERIQSTNVIKQSQICKQAELKYLKYWTKLLQLSKQKKKIVSYDKIKRLALDAYNLLQKNVKMGQDYEQLKTIIYQLQDYLILVKNHLKSYPTYSQKFNIANQFIDLQDFYLENDDDDQQIADYIPILKPFSDLNKFRTRNLQRLQFRRQQQTLKRGRDKFDELRIESQKNISMKQQASSQSLPQVVSQNQRKKIKQIFLKNIRKNLELKKYGQCENEVKMIQNQIFGQWHNDIIKYFEMSQSFQKLFIKLINCPHISNKIIKKKFEFKLIQSLVSNLPMIQQLQGVIANKLKQAQNEKAINKISQISIQKTVKAQRQNEVVMQSIASGKVDQTLKQQLKNQMKLIKQAKQKKQKSKKKDKHKHRSKSKSPDAKFSPQSRQQLPSYIQNQYNKDQTKPAQKKYQLQVIKPMQSPLRYDPQQDQIQNKQAIFPKGSIIKLKNCDIQINSKKKGKVQLPVEVLTEQEHKKILGQLFDPGFTRLSIRKDKNETEIIQYLSKSKKKYKYLICWFQSVNPEDNQLLKQISQDASDKKKIYGWQNQHVKIHIMSIKQLAQINRFNIPARVTTSSAANYLNNQRVIMIIQYPQKIYQIKDIYQQFAEIQKKNQEYSVAVPEIIIPQPPVLQHYYPRFTIPSIQQLTPIQNKPPIYEGGWGNQPVNLPPPSQPITQIPTIAPSPSIPISNISSASNIPYKINQIRMHFGFGSFSPILSDEGDDNEVKNSNDLANDLLNSLGDFGKIPAQAPQPPQRQKAPPQPVQQPQQQYPNYYPGGYNYQPQPQQVRTAPSSDGRWMGYQNMNQGMQSVPNQGQVYNPLNPMSGKFTNPPQMNQISGQMPNQMYKNPLMGQRPQMNNQYFRPPNSGDSYDSRYQGGYQQ